MGSSPELLSSWPSFNRMGCHRSIGWTAWGRGKLRGASASCKASLHLGVRICGPAPIDTEVTGCWFQEQKTDTVGVDRTSPGLQWRKLDCAWQHHSHVGLLKSSSLSSSPKQILKV